MSTSESQTTAGSDYPATSARNNPSDKLRISTSATRSSKSDNLPSPVSPPQSSGAKRTADQLDQKDSEGSSEEGKQHRRHHQRDHSLDSNTSASTPTLCICQRDPKIPRPRNAFILYRQHHAANLIARNPGISNPEISRIIGDQWRNQAPEIKDQWKALAEEEKQRHQQQFPNYRYQPKRNGKKGNNSDHPRNATSPHCQKCGGRSMVTPSTPLSTQTPSRPMLPPPTPSSASSAHSSHPMAPVNHASAHYSHHRPNDGHGFNSYALLHHPQSQEYYEGDRYLQHSPEAKRRRFTQGGTYGPGQYSRQSPPEGGVLHPGTPYHESFSGRHVLVPDWPPHQHPQVQGRDVGPLPPITSAMAPPPRPIAGVSTPRPTQEGSLVLPPIKSLPHEQSASESHLSNIPYLGKITTLGRIAPPLKSTGLASPGSIRGGVIAVEGDDRLAVSEVVQYLQSFLGRDDAYDVRVADGPSLPIYGQQSSIRDFLELVTEWHNKSREMIRFVTADEVTTEDDQVPGADKKNEDDHSQNHIEDYKTETPTNENDSKSQPQLHLHSPSNSCTTDTTSPPTTTASTASTAPTSTASFTQTPSLDFGSRDSSSSIPVVLLHTYHLAASNAYSAAIPIADTYSPNDHWQWVATLWRGTVGADITIYVRDASPEDMTKTRDVEVRPDARCVVVTREKSNSNNTTGDELKPEPSPRSDVGLGVSGVQVQVQHTSGRTIEEKTLRRLGFEIGEWVRSFGSGAADTGKNHQHHHHHQYHASGNTSGNKQNESYSRHGSAGEAGSEGSER